MAGDPKASAMKTWSYLRLHGDDTLRLFLGEQKKVIWGFQSLTHPDNFEIFTSKTYHNFDFKMQELLFDKKRLERHSSLWICQ